MYDNALHKSVCTNKLSYLNLINNTSDDNRRTKRKNRKRNIILFHIPHFFMLSKNNIGHVFLKLINKHFQNKFNRLNIKRSYSCTKNLFKIIDSRNEYILNKFNFANKKPIMQALVIVEIEIFVQIRGNAVSNVIYQASIYPKENWLNTISTLGFECGNGNKDFITIDTLFPTQD